MGSDSAGGHNWNRRSIFSRRTYRVRCILGQKICVERRAFKAFANFKNPENDGRTLVPRKVCLIGGKAVPRSLGCAGREKRPPRGRRTEKLGSSQERRSQQKSREPL